MNQLADWLQRNTLSLNFNKTNLYRPIMTFWFKSSISYGVSKGQEKKKQLKGEKGKAISFPQNIISLTLKPYNYFP